MIYTVKSEGLPYTFVKADLRMDLIRALQGTGATVSGTVPEHLGDTPDYVLPGDYQELRKRLLYQEPAVLAAGAITFSDTSLGAFFCGVGDGFGDKPRPAAGDAAWHRWYDRGVSVARFLSF